MLLKYNISYEQLNKNMNAYSMIIIPIYFIFVLSSNIYKLLANNIKDKAS